MIAKTNRAEDIIKAAAQQLSQFYDKEEVLAIIRLLIEERFGITRLLIATDPALVLTESQIVQVHKDLKKLKEGAPVQYVIGYTTFLDIKLSVQPGVLIPRPETEELTLTALELISDKTEPIILDIGTGSGAIAIALKTKRPDAQVFATDVSQDALTIAKCNAVENSADITFLNHDILNDSSPFNLAFDMIISNPPYIPDNEKAAMPKHVINHEPENALIVDGKDPLIFYTAIVEAGKNCIRENGLLLFETHHLYAENVARLLLNSRVFKNVKVSKDINGKQRFVIASKV